MRNKASNRVVKAGSVVSILRVLTKRGGADEVALSSEALAEGAVKLSRCAAGDHFLPPC